MAYTPGLKRKRYYTFRKIRKLPIKGDVLVKKGSQVSPDMIIMRSLIPGKVQIVDAATVLNIEAEFDKKTEEFSCFLTKYMLKKVGDSVEKDEVIAKRIWFFGMLKRFCHSPVKGTIESVSNVTGKVLIRDAPTPLDMKAYISGTVVEVIPEEAVIIESSGVFIQGIFGIGGETHGELLMVTESPSTILTDEQITSKCVGKILVAGALVTGKALRKAVEVGVKGIIVGGIEDDDLSHFLGYKLGVAITGKENVGLTLIVTEGFGKMAMAKKTFSLLKDYEGNLACINGATQIRAGVIRPEIIIPSDTSPEGYEEIEEITMEGMKPGLPIRIVRKPFFGAIGRIVTLPPQLQRIETGSLVRILEAELEDRRKVIIPRANIELIEE
jgi:hypothetical protein